VFEVAVVDEDRDRTARSVSSAAAMAIILTSAALPTITSLVVVCRVVAVAVEDMMEKAVEDVVDIADMVAVVAIVDVAVAETAKSTSLRMATRKRQKRRRSIRRWVDA
jgi:uncharacterized membrane protein YkvI